MDYDSPMSRYSSTIRFVAITLVLAILLILAIFISKQVITANTADSSKPQATKSDKKDKKSADKSVSSSAVQKRRTDEAKKKEEAKQAQEATTQAQNTPNSGVASSGPSTVTSTGPTENIIALVLGLSALGYGGLSFVRSRRDLARTIEQKHGPSSFGQV